MGVSIGPMEFEGVVTLGEDMIVEGRVLLSFRIRRRRRWCG